MARTEKPTRFAWLMERRLNKDSEDMQRVPAGTLVYWDGGHAESFTTDANKAVQWCRREDVLNCLSFTRHYEQWDWRIVEHGFIGDQLRAEGQPPQDPQNNYARRLLVEERDALAEGKGLHPLLQQRHEAVLRMQDAEARREAAEAIAASLRRALEQARDIIRIWHGSGVPDAIEREAWTLYQSSPEMQNLNAAIAALPTPPQTTTKEDRERQA
jgi:PAS domain-containing protein